MDDDERAARNTSQGHPRPSVRITGAQRASDVRSGGPDEEPAREHTGERAGDEAPDDEAPDDEVADFGHEDWELSEPAMPHWTEAPTGEVPAVLVRPGSGGGDPWASLSEPTWREDRSDWEQDEPITPSLLGIDEAEVPAPDEEEIEPWGVARSPRIGADEPGRGRSGAASRVDPEDHDDLFAAWMDTASRHDVAEPAPAPGFAGSGDPAGLAWEPDDIAGEQTTILPAVDAEHADAEAAALAADLEESGARRRWRSLGATAAGRNARHRRSRRTGVPAGVLPEPETRAEDFFARRKPTVPAAPAPSHELAEPPRTPRRSGALDADHVGTPEEGTHAGRAGRNVPLAIASGVVIGAVALVAFHFGSVPSLVVVTVLIALASMEAYAALRRAAYHPATLLGLVAVVALSVGAYTRGERAFALVLVLLVGFAFLWQLLGVDRHADPVRSVASTLLVFCWVGVFGAFAALLLAPSDYPDRHGIAYLLGAVVVGVAYDVGALTVGAWLGRHPLSRVSPGKTWEGAIGGTVAALVLAAAVVPLIHPWTLDRALALGVAVAIVCPIGDLCESIVKRHLGLKDMGRILPGHGGVLDRVDGLLFVLPATFYLLHAFHAG